MDLTQAYDAIWARKFEGIQPPSSQSPPDRVTWTLELLPKNAKAAGPLLDVGVGSGAMLARATGLGYEPVGADLSQQVVDWLRTNGYRAFQLDANRDKMRVDDGAFGVVTMCDVIEHLTDPGYALREARRALRHGGLLYVATPNCSFWRRVQQLAAGMMFKTSGDPELRDGGHVAYFAPKDLTEFITNCGFKVVDLYLRKYEACPEVTWSVLAALGARNRPWIEHSYMIACAVKA